MKKALGIFLIALPVVGIEFMTDLIFFSEFAVYWRVFFIIIYFPLGIYLLQD